MKFFSLFGVILITQVSCHSPKYHQPKGVIENLIPSEYQKNPYTEQNVEITKKYMGSNINFHHQLMNGMNGNGNIKGLRPMR